MLEFSAFRAAGTGGFVWVSTTLVFPSVNSSLPCVPKEPKMISRERVKLPAKRGEIPPCCHSGAVVIICLIIYYLFSLCSNAVVTSEERAELSVSWDHFHMSYSLDSQIGLKL